MLLATSTTLMPSSGSIVVSLFSSEVGLALLDETRDALAEILGAAAGRKLTVGDRGRLGERLEHRLVDLPFDDADRARRTEIGDLAGARLHGGEEAVGRQHAYQAHGLGLLRLDHARGEQEVERVHGPD